MTRQKLARLAENTADAAFIVDGNGELVAWNSAAEAFFGVPASDAIGRPCGQLIKGSDECGDVCGPNCTVLQAVSRHQSIRNFDLQTDTAVGRQWTNISVVLLDVGPGPEQYALHVVRSVDVRKRLEMAMRDFLVGAGAAPRPDMLAATRRLASANAPLSDREMEVLRLLAQGLQTGDIADQLHVARKTVSNHIQHAMQKLNARSRLEALRKAELAGMI